MQNNTNHQNDFQKEFKQQNRESAVDLIVNNIKNLLISKELRPGDRLPTETEISQSMAVSRGSVREAMKILSTLGIADIKRGDGTYISEQDNSVFIDPLLFKLVKSNANVNEVVELRELLEIGIIKLIFARIDQIDIQSFKNIYKETVNSLNIEKDPDVVARYDVNFHIELSKLTQNILIENIYEFVMDYFTSFIIETYHNTKNSQNADKFHGEIVEAICTKDYDKAVIATKNSIKEFQRIYSNTLII